MADANRKNMECKNVKKVEIKAQGSIPEEINKVHPKKHYQTT